ncbi:hypothetical protein GCM10028793_58040 [Nocardiopsis oceani]
MGKVRASGGLLLGAGFPVSCRLMVAVSAARVKVVAVEALARYRGRSTLTRFAATAGRRQSGNGGRVVGAARALRAPGLRPGPAFGPVRPSARSGLPAVNGRIPAHPPGIIGQRVAIQ